MSAAVVSPLMARPRQQSIRFSDDEAAWLAAEAERLTRELGFAVSVSDVVRRLIAQERERRAAERKSARKS